MMNIFSTFCFLIPNQKKSQKFTPSAPSCAMACHGTPDPQKGSHKTSSSWWCAAAVKRRSKGEAKTWATGKSRWTLAMEKSGVKQVRWLKSRYLCVYIFFFFLVLYSYYYTPIMKLSLFFLDNFHDPILKWNFAKHVTTQFLWRCLPSFLVARQHKPLHRSLAWRHRQWPVLRSGPWFQETGTFSERIGSR